jgi:hypothetical protein
MVAASLIDTNSPPALSPLEIKRFLAFPHHASSDEFPEVSEVERNRSLDALDAFEE